jgi:hypothetical protein
MRSIAVYAAVMRRWSNLDRRLAVEERLREVVERLHHLVEDARFGCLDVGIA